MNSRVCIDASIGLKLVIAEADSERVEQLWQSWTDDEVEIIAPHLFLYEGISVLRAKVFRKHLRLDEGEFAFRNLRAQGVNLLSPPDIYERAWAIARELNQPKVYDSYYLALAELLDCDLWTADERLFNAAKDKYPRVKWIGQIPERK